MNKCNFYLFVLVFLYSCTPQETPITLSVVTGDVTNITTTTADCSGNVTSDGGSSVTARGVCWSTTENPTTDNFKTSNGTGTGTFSSNLTGLSPNTNYYVRAYTTNSVGTAYGEDRFFTTLDPRQEATTLGGLITENTVLSINNSPYTITSDVQVAYNCTLTIEPGVIIYGNDKYITIWGVLNAIGSQDAKITFNNVNIAPGNNDQNELFLINVQHALINEGSLYKPTGYAIYGSINLKDSELTDIPYLYIWYPEANCNIERNIFNRCGGIMTVHNNNIKVYIRNNVFYQQADTSYSEFFAVANCASYDTSQTIVEFNSFLSTDKNALYLPTDYAGANIYAIKNFWNTTDLSVINTMIYDKNNDLGSANYIEFLPILTEPDTNTPVFNP
ncbi:MAG: hypothetical protein PHS48_07950 [Bacteroidales bacterium]|nr:hypothetical protein [Bacteroidales bacterium]